MKRYVITYEVSGVGQFPIDMLRYDRSFPYDGEQSSLITRTFHFHGQWTIRLSMHAARQVEGPGEPRWRSFGCQVRILDRRKL